MATVTDLVEAWVAHQRGRHDLGRIAEPTFHASRTSARHLKGGMGDVQRTAEFLATLGLQLGV